MVHPFRPHEAAEMLPDLPPAERALIWGMLGGVPQYLAWWDQQRGIQENLQSLVCTPGGRLLVEGELVMATEGGRGDLTTQTLYAIAGGRTKYTEIKDAVRTDPTRTLERLRELRLTGCSQSQRRRGPRAGDSTGSPTTSWRSGWEWWRGTGRRSTSGWGGASCRC